MTLQSFFSMGGYALYVWLAYGVGILVFSLIIYFPFKSHKKIRRQLMNKYRNDSAPET